MTTLWVDLGELKPTLLAFHPLPALLASYAFVYFAFILGFCCVLLHERIFLRQAFPPNFSTNRLPILIDILIAILIDILIDMLLPFSGL